jgi:Ca2+/H+ antiporter
MSHPLLRPVQIMLVEAATIKPTHRRPHGRKKDAEWVIEKSIASCIRVALFILPVLVILSWGLGIKDMSLFFDGFQVTILCLTILLVNYLVQTEN